MMTCPTFTYDQVRALSPCAERFAAATKAMGGATNWKVTPATFADLRAAGRTFDDLVWLASAAARLDADIERRVRLWLADCVACVVPIFEKCAPNDPRVRLAVVATRQFARGEIDDATRAAAWDAASAAAGAAAWVAARAAAWDAARDAAWAAAWVAARAAAWDAARDAAMDAAELWQFDRLVARMSAIEPEDWPLDAVMKDAA